MSKPDRPARMKRQGRMNKPDRQCRIKYPAERHSLRSASDHLIKMTGESFSCHFYQVIIR